jgi:hypothetical protein
VSGCGCGGTGIACKTNQKVVLTTGVFAFTIFPYLSTKMKIVVVTSLAGGYAAYNHIFNAGGVEGQEVGMDNYGMEEGTAFTETSYQLFDFRNHEYSFRATGAKVEGTVGDDFLSPSDEGGKLYAMEGNNFFGTSDGEDIYYFRLCGIDVGNEDAKVTTIQNVIGAKLDSAEDKINLFCGGQHVTEEDVSVNYDPLLEATIITIDTHNGPKAIAIIGEHRDIEFGYNEKWGDA